ncbi:peptidase [Prevotella koreensis]|uniref:peptidase n=1 Tax=Prevotella koreensis TaxID=2490854 RepID=UPI0028EC4841|nr:peptidase [Prevotella koreensis]
MMLLSCYSGDAIHSNIDGLTIKVIGTNNITTENSSTVKAYKPTSIIGTGVLNVKSNAYCAIYVEGTDLTIENCTVNAEGIDCGIAGLDGENEKLTIRNAKVTALGTEKGSIRDFSELNMIGCCITEPMGAWFGKSKHAVVLNGEIVKSKVVIDEIPAGVETPVSDNTGVQGIYTLSGIRLSGEPEDLPKGVYIVNGKKVVKP